MFKIIKGKWDNFISYGLTIQSRHLIIQLTYFKMLIMYIEKNNYPVIDIRFLRNCILITEFVDMFSIKQMSTCHVNIFD